MMKHPISMVTCRPRPQASVLPGWCGCRSALLGRWRPPLWWSPGCCLARSRTPHSRYKPSTTASCRPEPDRPETGIRHKLQFTIQFWFSLSAAVSSKMSSIRDKTNVFTCKLVINQFEQVNQWSILILKSPIILQTRNKIILLTFNE